MASLPLTGQFKSYRGAKASLQRKMADEARTAQRVAYHVNGLIANNPDEIQQHFFGSIAIDLGLTADQVRSAIYDGGYNGITVRVSERDRVALARVFEDVIASLRERLRMRDAAR